VITDISLDHQKFLGNTVAEIAREKAGILRRNGVAILLPQQREVNDVIGNAVLELESRALSAVPYVPPVSPGSDSYLKGSIVRYPLQVMGEVIKVETPLLGRHQLRNIALAIAAAEELANQGFPVTAKSIEKGIRQTRWAGRFQVLAATSETPEIIFDVAHNPAGAWALRSTLSAMYEDRELTFVFGTMQDKAIREIAEILFPVAARVILTPADNPRSATPADIREASKRIEVEIEDASDVPAALRRAKAIAGPGGVIVVTGSISIVGEAMRNLGVSV
jgi:dihydrofolate synthase/folylpolyglutamate synthase